MLDLINRKNGSLWEVSPFKRPIYISASFYLRFRKNINLSLLQIYSNPRVWAITRQICKRLGIMNHAQRHWRATQLADAMDPFALKETLHRAIMPFEYVRRAESRRLEREEEAYRIWA